MDGDLNVVVNLYDWESVDRLFEILMSYETFRMYGNFWQEFTGDVEDFFAYVKKTLGDKCDIYKVVELFENKDKLTQMSYYFNDMGMLDEYFIENYI